MILRVIPGDIRFKRLLCYWKGAGGASEDTLKVLPSNDEGRFSYAQLAYLAGFDWFLPKVTVPFCCKEAGLSHVVFQWRKGCSTNA